MITETFDTLHDEGATNGRLLVLHLHPWLTGQPFRIGYLDAALGHIMPPGRVDRHRAQRSSTGTGAIAQLPHETK